MKKAAGSFYIEAILSVAMIGILSTAFLPLFPKVIQHAQTLIREQRIMVVADYVGQYLTQWAQTPPALKPIPFSYYLSADGTHFDISGEKRVNRLLWAQNLVSDAPYLTDHYKTTIQFWETSLRNQSAVVTVLIWYDEDNDFEQDDTEPQFSFSLILSETMPYGG